MEHASPKKSLGQHFLTDRNIAAKIVRELDPQPEELLVEIGPGEGALTGMLVESPARMVAIELDPRMVERIEGSYGTRIEVLQQDILSADLAAIARQRGFERMRVIGNIPYYITSPIIFHLIDQREVVTEAVLMMQREVAERLVARPRTKEYGILAVMAQSYGTPKLLFNVGPRCFFPPPKVTSAVVRLRFQPIEGLAGIEPEHRAIVRSAFNQRRKTLRNALAQLAGIDEQEHREGIFEEAAIDPRARAEELSPADFVRLARAYHTHRGSAASGPSL